MQGLANEVQMASIDSTPNIEEMAGLCRELLRSDAPDGLLLGAVETLGGVIDNGPLLKGRPLPNQTIECLREANSKYPLS